MQELAQLAGLKNLFIYLPQSLDYFHVSLCPAERFTINPALQVPGHRVYQDLSQSRLQSTEASSDLCPF